MALSQSSLPCMKKLDQLPKELLHIICTYLCPYGLSCALQVSWDFYSVAIQESLWQPCCQCLFVHPLQLLRLPLATLTSPTPTSPAEVASSTTPTAATPPCDEAYWNEHECRWSTDASSSNSSNDGFDFCVVKGPTPSHSCRLSVACVLAKLAVVDPTHADDSSMATTNSSSSSSSSRPLKQTLATAFRKILDIKRHGLSSLGSSKGHRDIGTSGSVPMGFPYSTRCPVFNDLLTAMKHINNISAAAAAAPSQSHSRRKNKAAAACVAEVAASNQTEDSSDHGGACLPGLCKQHCTVLLLPGCYCPLPIRGFPLPIAGDCHLVGSSNDPLDVQIHVPAVFGSKGTQFVRNVTFFCAVEVNGSVRFANCHFLSGLDVRSGHCHLCGCSVTDNGGNGVVFRASASGIVQGCIITKNRASAIDIQTTQSVMVQQTRIFENGNGILSGVMCKEGCVITDNEIFRNTTGGIILKQSAHADIRRNKIHHCGWGLVLKDESSVVFESNECFANIHSALCIQTCCLGSKFLKNSIHGERRGVVVNGREGEVHVNNGGGGGGVTRRVILPNTTRGVELADEEAAAAALDTIVVQVQADPPTTTTTTTTRTPSSVSPTLWFRNLFQSNSASTPRPPVAIRSSPSPARHGGGGGGRSSSPMAVPGLLATDSTATVATSSSGSVGTNNHNSSNHNGNVKVCVPTSGSPCGWPSTCPPSPLPSSQQSYSKGSTLSDSMTDFELQWLSISKGTAVQFSTSHTTTTTTSSCSSNAGGGGTFFERLGGGRPMSPAARASSRASSPALLPPSLPEVTFGEVTCSPLFEGNTIQDCTRCGISVKSGACCRIFSNEVTRCRRGIFLQKSSYAIVRGNDISHSQRCGMEVEASSSALVVDNRIHHCSEMGVLVTTHARVVVRHNELNQNNLLAIAVKTQASPLIKENVIMNHRRGIDLSDCGRAIVEGNDISKFSKTALTIRGGGGGHTTTPAPAPAPALGVASSSSCCCTTTTTTTTTTFNRSHTIVRDNHFSKGRHGIVVYGGYPCTLGVNHFDNNTVNRATLSVMRGPSAVTSSPEPSSPVATAEVTSSAAVNVTECASNNATVSY